MFVDITFAPPNCCPPPIFYPLEDQRKVKVDWGQHSPEQHHKRLQENVGEHFFQMYMIIDKFAPAVDAIGLGYFIYREKARSVL